MVRAKFRCTEETTFLGYAFKDGKMTASILYRYKFSPVAADSPENAKFYEATPSGTLELATLKEKMFEVGKEYYLDITPSL